MRHTIVFFLLCSAIPGACPLEAADNPQSAERVEPAVAEIPQVGRASGEIVVRRVAYGLEGEGRRLYLSSQPLNGNDRQFKRFELEFQPAEGEIVDLVLAPMGEKNLLGAIKVRNAETFHFYCVTLIGPWGGGHVRDKHVFHQAKLLSTRDQYRIVALDGRHNTATVILGRRDPKEQTGLLSDGVLFFSGCPWPPECEMGTFRVSRVPEPEE